jgi:hypothetical protein
MPVNQYLNLILHSAAQASKETTFNLNAIFLQAAAARGAESYASAPPTTPTEGALYLVKTTASGDWAGKSEKIALWLQGWYFFTPQPGCALFIKNESLTRVYNGSAWQAAAGPFSAGVGGAWPDSTDFFSVLSQASLFNNAGAGHKITVNKNATADKANLEFYKNKSFRGLIGLSGNNSLRTITGDAAGVTRAGIDWSTSTGRAFCFRRLNFNNGISTNAGADVLTVESGTWTPALGTMTGGPPTYAVQSGRYYKIGNICFMSFRLKLSAKNGVTGNVNITGLPFVVASATFLQSGSYASYASGVSLNSGEVLGFSTISNTNQMQVIYRAVTGTVAATDTKITDSFEIKGSIICRI